MPPVKLSEVIEGIEMHLGSHETLACFIEKTTGRLVSVNQEVMSWAEEAEEDEPEPDFPDWQLDELETAREILDRRDDFLSLPSSFDVHEYSIMEAFCASIEDDRVRDRLLGAIRGSGAFRRFKDGIHRFGIADEWYRYRDARIKEIAIEWCTANGLPYVDDTSSPG